MNYLKPTFAVLAFALFSSCSNDDFVPEPEITTPIALKNYIFKRYDVTTSPNTVIDSINFQLENNRIASSSGESQRTVNAMSSESTFTYLGNTLTTIRSFRNGAPVRNASFTYDSNGNLTSFISESINTAEQVSFYNRHLFTHTQDTIFAQWEQSDDGVNFDTSVLDIKIVLDQNNNRIYFEAFDHINGESRSIHSTYDTNNNLISEISTISQGGVTVPGLTSTYTYENKTNPFAIISEATYGRKTLMLLYHAQSDNLNGFNARSISPFAMQTFSSSFSDSISFEIQHIFSSDHNIVSISDFRTVINHENLFNRFTQEYTLE